MSVTIKARKLCYEMILFHHFLSFSLLIRKLIQPPSNDSFHKNYESEDFIFVVTSLSLSTPEGINYLLCKLKISHHHPTEP
jgi:hypothetical protein